MKKMIVVVLSLCGFFMIKAQDASQKLLSNSNITWVAESKAFISFENAGQKAYHDDVFLYEKRGNTSGSELLKIDPDVLCEQEYYSYFLSKKINDGLEAGTLKAFNEKGQEITEHVLDEMIVSIDTLVTFDPNTYEKTVEIAKGKVLYDWYEVTLIYYYDAKKKEMNSILKSLAPIIRVEKFDDGKGRLSRIKKYESFIIPMEQLAATELGINDESVVWAKLSDLNTLDFSKAKVLKGETGKALKTIFHDNIMDGHYDAFQNRDGCDKEIVDASWINEYKENVELDTFITFNPENMEEKIEIEKPISKFDDIYLLGVRHLWYWDTNRNQLVCDLKTVRFYKETYDDLGNFLFGYLMYEVDFKK